MTDLEKLKEAFDKNVDDSVMGAELDSLTADLFWPFVEHVLTDPEQSIKHLGLINTLKFKLGMPLMAHEMVGVELESQGPIK